MTPVCAEIAVKHKPTVSPCLSINRIFQKLWWNLYEIVCTGWIFSTDQQIFDFEFRGWTS